MVNFRSLLLFSAFLRVFLIIYGEWQDAHMEVRYTDVDYLVFSDAASLIASGKSPYQRSTYRYSPLLAFLLIPNSIIHHSWGKIFFSAADLLVGLLIRSILKLRRVPENLCTCSVMVWLLNPFTFTIGTRGNCEPVVCAMVLWIIICLLNGKVLQAAVWYGLLVHFRIYPIIYALPIVMILDPLYYQFGQKPTLSNWSSSQGKLAQGFSSKVNLYDIWITLTGLFTRGRLLFGLVSGAVFFACTGFFFYLYRWEFLHEALLYHLTRTDPRHNFSIYFYHIYLHYGHEFSVVEKLISFLPQFMVQLVLIFCCARDLPFCFFVQTVAFVAFNKLVDKDPEKTIPLLWAAINAGDRVDSALKDMAIAMKQQNRAEEAIEAIKSLRYRCSDEAQESLDNILLDLYKACGRLDDQIALLRHKLDLLYQGKAFNGKPTKIARSRGKRLQISVDQEIIRLQGNLGWALMQQKKCLEAEVAYRQAIFLAPNNNNQMCNLAMCLMKQGKIAAAKKTLQQVNPTVAGLDSPLRSFQSAQQLLEDIESGRETLPPPPPRWQQHTLEEERYGILILMLDIFNGLKRLHQ